MFATTAPVGNTWGNGGEPNPGILYLAGELVGMTGQLNVQVPRKVPGGTGGTPRGHAT